MRKEAERPQLPVCASLRGAETTEPCLRFYHVGTCVMKLPLTMGAFRAHPRLQGWGYSSGQLMVMSSSVWGSAPPTPLTRDLKKCTRKLKCKPERKPWFYL